MTDAELFGDGSLDKILRIPSFSEERFSKTLLVGCGGNFKGKAGIATVLVPLLEDSGTHSKLTIVGNDGPNISKEEDYPWFKFLVSSLAAGTEIDYLLIKPSASARLKLGELRKSYPTTFHPLEPKGNEISKYQERLKQWETFHFVIAENPGALWIENHHPYSEIEAQDCWYFETENVLSLELKSRLEEIRPCLKALEIETTGL